MNLKSGIEVIDIEIRSLKLLKKKLSKSFSDAVELLYKTKGKIIVSGIDYDEYCTKSNFYININ